MNPDHDLTAEPLDDLDERILAGIADVLRSADPVPAGLADDIKFALTVQAMHAEVAELQRVGAESALARSEYTRTQTLTFSAEALSVMVTLSPIDGALLCRVKRALVSEGLLARFTTSAQAELLLAVELLLLGDLGVRRRLRFPGIEPAADARHRRAAPAPVLQEGLRAHHRLLSGPPQTGAGRGRPRGRRGRRV